MCWPNKINSMKYSVLIILLSIPAVFGADQAEGEELIDDLLKKSEQARKDLEIKVEDTVQKVLKKMDVATKKEIARLEKKVRNLEKKKASGNKTSMS